MKVVIVNHSDTKGGASVVSFRLMEALRAEGIDARMLVGEKNSSSPFVEQAASRARVRIPFYKEHLRIYLQNGFSRSRLFQASIATDGLPLSSHPLVREADAVILNWVNQGLLSLKEIGRIARLKPIFWVMHDQWNFTGICHHTGGCDKFMSHCHNCPLVGWEKGSRDLSYRTFERKKSLYGSASITFIAVSPWLAHRAAQSELLKGQKVESVANAFPVERFAGSPKYSRGNLWLPEDKKLIVFCAARIDDPGKGLSDAIERLNSLVPAHKHDVFAVFVGAMRNPHALDSLRLPHIWIPPVADDDKIASIMAHATAALSTSPFETFSTTMIEAQAAGATPVCYTHDGRGDIVTDGVDGYSLSVRPTALYDALFNPIDRAVLKKSAQKYSASSVAKQIIRIISQH